LTMGWETAAEKITCDEALQRNPDAYICHQYFGTWKASYNHRPALTYSSKCRYWGLNQTEAEAAALSPWHVTANQQTTASSHMNFFDDFESTEQQVEDEDEEEGGEPDTALADSEG